MRNDILCPIDLAGCRATFLFLQLDGGAILAPVIGLSSLSSRDIPGSGQIFQASVTASESDATARWRPPLSGPQRAWAGSPRQINKRQQQVSHWLEVGQ